MVPLGLVAMFSLATSAASFLLPDLVLQDVAEKRRRAFRHTPSYSPDLVNALLAGGGRIENALSEDAAAADSWGYLPIRTESRKYPLTRPYPWHKLPTTPH